IREATVDAADPACAQETDPRRPADGERSADGRRADDALDGSRGEVARPDLPSVGVEPPELGLRQPDDDLAVEDSDRRRDRTRGPHPSLRLESDRHALARWEAVRDERRLERDDRARLADLVCDANHSGQLLHGIVPSFAMQRAAASTASSG